MIKFIKLIKNTTFKLLSKMIEETHRFAITYHRKKRDKSLSVSVLDNIKGVGRSEKRSSLINLSQLIR